MIIWEWRERAILLKDYWLIGLLADGIMLFDPLLPC